MAYANPCGKTILKSFLHVGTSPTMIAVAVFVPHLFDM